jgi:hypothetical protein
MIVANSEIIDPNDREPVTGLPVHEKNLTDWQREIMKWAEEKGWNQGLDERSFGDWCMLFVTEIAEAYEDYRENRTQIELYYEHKSHPGQKFSWETVVDFCQNSPNSYFIEDFKPCGIPMEKADAMIRLLHWFEHNGLNANLCIAQKMAYNERRPYRHGGKRI